MRTIAVSLMVVLLAVPGVALAQSVQEAIVGSGNIDGYEIAVVDRAGVETIGRFRSISDRRLTLILPSGPRAIETTDIYRIERVHDDNADGLITGAAIGALLGVLAGKGFGNAGVAAAGVAGFAALFGTVGYMIDRDSDSRQLLYQAPHKITEKKIATNFFQFKF